jgi:hypothetical protein
VLLSPTEETGNSAANKEEALLLKKGQEKQEKKDKKKREGGRVEKTIRMTLSKARKTQKQGRELHQHNTPSSPSSSSSPKKASAEGEKTKRDQNRRGHRFLCPQKQQPLAERRSFSTCCLRPSQRQLSRKGKQNREEGKEKRRKQGEERRKRQATQEESRTNTDSRELKKLDPRKDRSGNVKQRLRLSSLNQNDE